MSSEQRLGIRTQSHQPQSATQIHHYPPPPPPPVSAPQLTSPGLGSGSAQASQTQLYQQSSAPAPLQHETSRKRARPTVSCFECRRKKLKCDRVQPCCQCVKGHREGLCQFAVGPEAARSGGSRGKLRTGEDVLGGDGRDGSEAERLGKRARVDGEAPLSLAAGSVDDGVGEIDGDGDEAVSMPMPMPIPNLGRIYVKGTRSRYLGIADRMAMLDHVSVLMPHLA